jgi:NAD:arginine ADP-ribosyltransferase
LPDFYHLVNTSDRAPKAGSGGGGGVSSSDDASDSANDDSAASRVTDVQEDGRVRSPLASLFKPDGMSIAPNVLESMRPVGKAGLAPKNLQQCIRIATAHVHSLRSHANCSPIVTNVTETDAVAIALYSMENSPKEDSVYHLVNTALRSDNRDDVKPWVSYIWLLCNALHKLPRPSEEASTLYRGCRLPLANGAQLPSTMLDKGKSAKTCRFFGVFLVSN